MDGNVRTGDMMSVSIGSRLFSYAVARRALRWTSHAKKFGKSNDNLGDNSAALMSGQSLNDGAMEVVWAWRQSAHGATEHLCPGQPRKSPFALDSLGTLRAPDVEGESSM